MTLSKQVSNKILLVLCAAMLLAGMSYIMQGYFSFKRETLTSAKNSLNSLGIFEAVHIQAMLNRGTVEDNDPAILTGIYRPEAVLDFESVMPCC